MSDVPADVPRDAAAQATGSTESLEATLAEALGAPLPIETVLERVEAGRPVVVPRADVLPLRLTGADRADFLHGQISAPVRGRPPGTFAPGLMLDPRGHARAELVTCVREDDLYVAVLDDAGAYVAAELERHIVFDQVELTSLATALASLTVMAPSRLLDALGAEMPGPEAFVQPPFGDAKLLVHRALAAPSGAVSVHLLRRQLEDVLEFAAAHDTAWTTPAELEALRVAAGVPLAPRDAGAGVLPQEAGLEPLVSYTKGCYLGQEIMARIEARGSLKRSLVGMRLAPGVSERHAESETESEAGSETGSEPGSGTRADAPADAPVDAQADVGVAAAPPPVGTDVTADGKRVGRLGSHALHPVHGWIALAVLRDDAAHGAAELSVGDWTARVARLPFDAPG